MFPEELVRKSWTESGYPPKDMLGTTNETTIFHIAPNKLALYWKDSRTNFDSIECDTDPHFTETDDDSVDEVEHNFA